MAFKKARDFVRNLGLKGSKEWRVYVATGEKPSDIPTNPNQVYKEFQNMGDWLGTFSVATQDREYLSFTEAKNFVKNLSLKSHTEFELLKKSGKIPKNIPSSLPGRYKNKGWKGWADFLGKED